MADSNPMNMLNKIKNSIFGKQSYDSIEKVDDIIDKISAKVVDRNLPNQLELLRKGITSGIDAPFFDKLGLALYDNIEYMDRMSRYRNGFEIVDYVPYCARALKVISDGILSPDEITKKSIQITTSLDGNKEQTEINYIRNIVDTLDIDRTLYTEIRGALQNGDAFIEVLDYSDEEIPLTKTILSEGETTEGNEYNDALIESNVSFSAPYLKENSKEVDINNTFDISKNIQIEIVGYQKDFTSILSEESSTDNKKSLLQNIRVIRHDPRTVLKIQSLRHKFCLGYLVFPDLGLTSANTGPSASTGAGGGTTKVNTAYNSTNINFASSMSSMNGIDSIYMSLITKIRDLSKSNQVKIDKPDVMAMLNRIIKELMLDDTNSAITNGTRFQIRFVPENRMSHFYYDNTRFFPYGESIFQKVLFKAKVLILLETANTIKRLSESTEKRIVYYEAGANNRDSRNVVEQIKSQLNKISYSVDASGSIAQIPSMMHTMETLYIPQTKQKRFIEFDRLEPNPDLRSMSEDLKFLRDEIVAGLDVPPPYLAIEDQGASNKNSLAFENAIFAETLIGYQYTLNPCLKELIKKIYRMIRSDAFPSHINVGFPPPRMLQLEREAEQIDFGTRSIQSLKDIGVPVEWSKRKYLPQIPWEIVENFRTKDALRDKLGTGEPDPMDAMGGLGGGMGTGGGGISTGTDMSGGISSGY